MQFPRVKNIVLVLFPQSANLVADFFNFIHDGPEESWLTPLFLTLKWDNFWSRMARRTFDGAFESWDFIIFHERTFRIVRTPREELRALEGIWYFSKKNDTCIHTIYSKYQDDHRFTGYFLHIWGFGTYWRWNKYCNTISWPIPAYFKFWNFMAKKFPRKFAFFDEILNFVHRC